MTVARGAEAVSPGCSGAPGWAEAVRRLVRRLDANPLALECAAARMTMLTPDALLTRLDTRCALLRAPSGQGARGLWEALNLAHRHRHRHGDGVHEHLHGHPVWGHARG